MIFFRWKAFRKTFKCVQKDTFGLYEVIGGVYGYEGLRKENVLSLPWPLFFLSSSNFDADLPTVLGKALIVAIGLHNKSLRLG